MGLLSSMHVCIYVPMYLYNVYFMSGFTVVSDSLLKR